MIGKEDGMKPTAFSMILAIQDLLGLRLGLSGNLNEWNLYRRLLSKIFQSTTDKRFRIFRSRKKQDGL